MGKQKYQQTTKSVDGAPVKSGREHYSHEKADARKDKRRQEAEARDRHYRSLPVTARIALAKSRKGESKREIARLTALLVKQPEYPKSSATSTDTYWAEKARQRTPKSKIVEAAKMERPSKS